MNGTPDAGESLEARMSAGVVMMKRGAEAGGQGLEAKAWIRAGSPSKDGP